MTRDGTGEIVLSWAPDCGGGTSYGVYRGDLVVGYDSIEPAVGMCEETGNTATIMIEPTGAEFFLVVPNDGAHSLQELAGKITLPAGLHPIIVTYFEGGGGEALSAYWSGPGIGKEEIPSKALFHQPSP